VGLLSFFLENGISALTFLFGIMIFYVLLPGSARTRFKARYFARTGALVTLVTDDGFEVDKIMKVDLENGILTDGRKTIIFTPNPVFADEEFDFIGPDGTVVKKTKQVLLPTTEQKKTVDSAILKRSISDTGKPHYTCLVNKGIAVSPELLGLIQAVDSRVTENGRVYQGDLVDPQILKSYFKGTFSAITLSNMEYAAERRGFLRRPMQDFLSKNALPIGMILIVIIVGYMFISGKIDIARIFGGVLPG